MIDDHDLSQEHLIERERMRQLGSDSDVLAACLRYENWLDINSEFEDLEKSALSQKIIFFRRALETGQALRDALIPRINQNFDDLLVHARRTPENVLIAATYVVKCIRTNVQLLDYDSKFLFMAGFLEEAHTIYKTQQSLEVVGRYNALLGGVASDKSVFAAKLAKGGTTLSHNPSEIMDDYLTKTAFTPFVEFMYGRSFGLGSSINNRDGLHAWGEGREIVDGLARYITSPESRGRLCSLLSPEGETCVEWRKNTWVSDPRFMGWFMWSNPKEMMDYFEMMNAQPSIILNA